MSRHVKVDFNEPTKRPFEVNNTIGVTIDDGICSVSIDDGGRYKIPMSLIAMIYEGPDKNDSKEKREKEFQSILENISTQLPPVTVKSKISIPE